MKIWFKKYNVIVDEEKGQIIGKKKTLEITPTKVQIEGEQETITKSYFNLEPNILDNEENLYSLKEIKANRVTIIDFVQEFELVTPIITIDKYYYMIDFVRIFGTYFSSTNDAMVCDALMGTDRCWEHKERRKDTNNKGRILELSYYMRGRALWGRCWIKLYVYLDNLTADLKEEIFEQKDYTRTYEPDEIEKIKENDYEPSMEIHVFAGSDITLDNYAEEAYYSREIEDEEEDIEAKMVYIIDASIPFGHKDYDNKRFEVARVLTRGYNRSPRFKLTAYLEFHNIYMDYYKNAKLPNLTLDQILDTHDKILRWGSNFKWCRVVHLEDEKIKELASELEDDLVIVEPEMLEQYIKILWESAKIEYDEAKEFGSESVMAEIKLRLIKYFEEEGKHLSTEEREEILKKVFSV